MTQMQEKFLTLLRAALHNEQSELQLSNAELQEILEMAMKQHLLPVIAEMIPWDSAHAEDNLLVYRQYAIRQSLTEAGRMIDFHALYRSLKQAGVRAIVIKGVLCSRLYPWEYHRITADNDLYISDEELESCHHALLSYGLHTETPVERLHHEDEITYKDDNNHFYIELHRSLFDSSNDTPDDLNHFFENSFNSSVESDEFYSLNAHEHLLYLLLHAYKHFIYSGVGIRQTCDIALWAHKYADQIDWERLLDECIRVHAGKFAAAQFRIAEKCLGFSLSLPDCWRNIEVDVKPMLDDMFDGGVYGSADLTRLHTATITLNAIRKSRSGEKSSILRSIFPEKSYMAGRYPYIEKHPILLPAAWASRIFHYLQEICCDSSSNAFDSLNLAKERIELLEYYGVIL